MEDAFSAARVAPSFRPGLRPKDVPLVNLWDARRKVTPGMGQDEVRYVLGQPTAGGMVLPRTVRTGQADRYHGYYDVFYDPTVTPSWHNTTWIYQLALTSPRCTWGDFLFIDIRDGDVVSVYEGCWQTWSRAPLRDAPGNFR